MVKEQRVYTVDTDTEEGLRKAGELRQRLYDKYNSVQVYPNGLYQVRIVAEDRITA